MKDSGIGYVGSIPRHWATVKLKYLTKIRSEKGLFNPDLALYIGLENIVGYSNGIFPTDTTYDISVQNVCEKGDILFGKLRPYLAKVIFAPYDGYCSGEFLIFSDFVGDKRFLRFSLLNKNFIDVINSSTYGAKMPRANSQYILNLAIALPPLLEQRRIADYLDDKCAEIDKVVEKTRETIEEYKKLKQSIITETVTKGLNPDAEMKDSGIPWIGKIPVEWVVIPAKHAITVSNGSDPLSDEGDTPVYGSGNKSFKTCGEFKEGPAVLLGRKGTIGIPQWIEGKYWNVDTSFDVKAKKLDFLLNFYYYLAVCFDYKSYTTQTALPSMTQTQYLNMRIPLPSFLDQHRIADYLDTKCAALDNIIEKKEQLIEELGSYKKSLIYEYVTGKKEVQA